MMNKFSYTMVHSTGTAEGTIHGKNLEDAVKNLLDQHSVAINELTITFMGRMEMGFLAD
jgi:hypothetical protein